MKPKKKKERKQCEFCRKRKGTTRTDPYREDVWNEIVDVDICDKCYAERCLDI